MIEATALRSPYTIAPKAVNTQFEGDIHHTATVCQYPESYSQVGQALRSWGSEARVAERAQDARRRVDPLFWGDWSSSASFAR